MECGLRLVNESTFFVSYFAYNNKPPQWVHRPLTTDWFIRFTAQPVDGAYFRGHTCRGKFPGLIVAYEKSILKCILEWHTVLVSRGFGFDSQALVQG